MEGGLHNPVSPPLLLHTHAHTHTLPVSYDSSEEKKNLENLFVIAV